MSTLVAESSGLSLSASRRKPIISSNLFGTLVFVLTEIMFFMALISAFIIIKGNNPRFLLPEGLVLPIAVTTANTAILTFSAFLLFLCGRSMKRGESLERVERLLLAALITGVIFVVVQGFEWVQLIRFGTTMQSSIFGACFFLLIGAHGLHAIGAIFAMIYVLRILRSGQLRRDHIQSLQTFWFFVVGIWPVLYWLVYF